MSCDVGEVTERLENELCSCMSLNGPLIISSVFYIMGGSPGDISEEPVTYEKRKKGWRMSCDVGEATEGLKNEL